MEPCTRQPPTPVWIPPPGSPEGRRITSENIPDSPKTVCKCGVWLVSGWANRCLCNYDGAKEVEQGEGQTKPPRREEMTPTTKTSVDVLLTAGSTPPPVADSRRKSNTPDPQPSSSTSKPLESSPEAMAQAKRSPKGSPAGSKQTSPKAKAMAKHFPKKRLTTTPKAKAKFSPKHSPPPKFSAVKGYKRKLDVVLASIRQDFRELEGAKPKFAQ